MHHFGTAQSAVAIRPLLGINTRRDPVFSRAIDDPDLSGHRKLLAIRHDSAAFSSNRYWSTSFEAGGTKVLQLRVLSR